MARVTLPEPISDGPLLAAAAAGDRAAFETLVDRHKSAVFRHARRQGCDARAIALQPRGQLRQPWQALDQLWWDARDATR